VFTRTEVDFGRKLGATLSLAIENARLYEEQQRIALTLQENLMHEPPSVPGLEIGMIARSAFAPALVGGDFSDGFVLDDGQVAVLIGDVAGKGLEAAGLTETVRSTVRAFAMIDASPAFVLSMTNELLLRHDPDGPIVTAFYCLLDPRTGHLAYASAGHPAPIHLGPHLCRPLAVRFGVPLGSFAQGYEGSHTTLTLDDYLVLYTDGIIEARREREQFGERRLVAAIAGLRGSSAQELAESLVDDVGRYADRLTDDIEVIALRLA
jgi:serine phosphatase RsbU (regulator of sigma subunit)